MNYKMTRKESAAMTKEELVEYIVSTYEKGFKYSDVSEKRLPKTGVIIKNAVFSGFGNVVDMCKAVGVPEEEFLSIAGRVRHYSSIKDKEDLDRDILEIHESEVRGLSEKGARKTFKGRVAVNASKRIYGSWEMALYRNGIRPIAITDERIIEEITPKVIKLYEDGLMQTEISRDMNISVGMVRSILDRNGIEVFNNHDWFEKGVKYLDKEAVDSFIKSIIEGSKKGEITAEYIRDNHRLEYNSIRRIYGNVSNAVISSGEYVLDKPVPRRWSREFLIEQIKKGYADGEMLNTTYLSEGDGSSVITYAREEFGSWKEAIESAGIPYNKVNMNSDNNSDLGHRFEGIVDELFDDIGLEYCKEGNGRWMPDYIIGDKWVDAKLSQYTYLGKDREGLTVIDKYEPYCEELEIVYLLGTEGIRRKVTDKTTLVHVNEYVKLLPTDKQATYRRRLDDIKNDIAKRRGA